METFYHHSFFFFSFYKKIITAVLEVNIYIIYKADAVKIATCQMLNFFLPQYHSQLKIPHKVCEKVMFGESFI